MKLDAVLALIKPFLAADAKPEQIKAAIIAADAAKDKVAKDKAAKDKAAKDRKEAYDKARDSMSDKDKEAFDAMPEGEEKDKVAKDACATDPEHTNDEEVEAEDNDLSQAEPGTSTKGVAPKKPTVDSADVDQRVKVAVAAAVAARDELHTATTEVGPIVGARTFDNAGAAYKAGLEALGVDLEGVPPSAYRAMLKLAKDRGHVAPTLAADAASVVEVQKLIPNYNRL